MRVAVVLALVLLLAVIDIPQTAAASWGCPFNQKLCNNHCILHLKCRGGYCKPSSLWLECKCIC
ncbi:hypothetical protein ACJMK2_023620 [Sinanodonta woodiana]|uniref:Defensin n=1 Tax=Sinanodonta woodiana TaxID=1069815 RepID=A0ABD3T5E1_SINWO